jgi:hypothetical protein
VADAGFIARFELDDDIDGIREWRVGLVSCRDRWHELTAAHAVKGDASQREQDAAQDAFAVDVVANTVVWEQYDTDEEDAREPLTPGQVAAWPDELTPDVWNALVEQCFRVSGPGGFEWALERLRRAPMLALEMAVAREYRIPYSQLARWSDDDRALAIADLVEQRTTCTGCGVPKRAMRDVNAAVVEAEQCVWCEMLAQAHREAGAGEHPRIAMKAGY